MRVFGGGLGPLVLLSLDDRSKSQRQGAINIKVGVPVGIVGAVAGAVAVCAGGSREAVGKRCFLRSMAVSNIHSDRLVEHGMCIHTTDTCRVWHWRAIHQYGDHLRQRLDPERYPGPVPLCGSRAVSQELKYHFSTNVKPAEPSRSGANDMGALSRSCTTSPGSAKSLDKKKSLAGHDTHTHHRMHTYAHCTIAHYTAHARRMRTSRGGGCL